MSETQGIPTPDRASGGATSQTIQPQASAPASGTLGRTVHWRDGALWMIDQRRLPDEELELELRDVDAVAEAIRDMAVRGAPAIGATAGFGMAIAAANIAASSPHSNDAAALRAALEREADTLRRSRPTASNLFWAVDRMLARADRLIDAEAPPATSDANGEPSSDEPRRTLADTLRDGLLAEAQRIADEDVEICRRMGANGAALLPSPARVIHHCNTGALAAVDHGTALGVVRSAHEAGKQVHVLVDETRPRLQGARLTTWELKRLGIPQTLIADGAAGYHLQQGGIDAVLVGADRVAANGDTANKIGTYPLAVLAKENGVPFYVVAPTSTVDLAVETGAGIPIEQRDEDEVLRVDGRRIAPEGVQAANPAFDVTPQRYVTAIVTEEGVVYPPFVEGLRAAVAEGVARRERQDGDQ